MARPRLAAETERFSLTLPSDVASEIRAMAARKRIPVGSVLRELIATSLERQRLVDRIASAVEPIRAVV